MTIIDAFATNAAALLYHWATEATCTDKGNPPVREIVRTNDPVLVNFIESLLRQGGCEVMVADQNMSIMEGSIGAFPRRILVADRDFREAKSILEDADLGQWIISERP
ncbi:MAG: DUF2007 domain-containing protein [Pseudomonadota bacterium]